MKYENFKAAKDLYEKIEKHNSNLYQLDNSCEVVIQRPSGGRIYTIGIDGMCEHEYRDHAKTLVVALRNDLNYKIEALKAQLSEL